jgi:hypothetical protein
MARKEKKPLGMTCTSTDCESGLHCFRQTKKRGEEHVCAGRCRDCGADLVDWSRVHRRDFGDVEYTFRSLKYELIRHHFWHQELDLRAVNYARRKGTKGLDTAAEKRIRQSLGAADPVFDGRQTGKSGNPLLYAQHACASCCRKCVEYWHGIEQHRALSGEEIQYLKLLLMLYIKDRLPSLTTDGEYVPQMRSNECE